MMTRTVVALCAALALASPIAAQTRIGDVTSHEGEVPVRLVGYGLVVGLDGTGDRSFGNSTGAIHTVHSVANLLRRFNVDVPAERLGLRNVAAVLVTAELSPFLRPGGRFDVQVASLGDATSLAGGTLWITPLVANPDDAPLATAQGSLAASAPEWARNQRLTRVSNGRIADGGVLEVAQAAIAAAAAPRLLLRQPDLALAVRVAAAIRAVHGDSSAKVEDPGLVSLKVPASAADNLSAFLAAVDTLAVEVPSSARIVVDARSGMVVAGGDVRVGPAVISFRGITVRVRAEAADSVPVPGALLLGGGATVQDVAAGLHALGAAPADVGAVFEALRASGAIRAVVVIR